MSSQFVSEQWLSKQLAEYKESNSKVDLTKYKDDPKGFFRDVLGIEHTWDKQLQIPESIIENKRVSVRSAHKTGKTFICAATALWWVCTKRTTKVQQSPKVVIVASTTRQVKDLLWHELSLLYQKASNLIGGELNISPATGLKFNDGRYIVGFATDDPIKLQGYSGVNLLWLVDEASGVDDDIYKAIRANTAGGGRLLAIGNPNYPVGWFYDSFEGSNQIWTNVHLTAMDAAPHAHLIPGLHQPDAIETMKIECGPDYESSPEYQVRVLGEFPSFASSALFNLELLQTSVDKWKQEDFNSKEPLEVGVDIARSDKGDDTVVQLVRGKFAYKPILIPAKGGKETAAAIHKVIKNHLLPGEKFPQVNIDIIGVGASPSDFLKELGIKVNEVNVGKSAKNDKYFRLRCELYMQIKEELRKGLAIPDDIKLKQELIAHQWYITGKGKVRVEEKDRVRPKISRSPDRADALALALFERIGKSSTKTIKHYSVRKKTTAGVKKFI